MSSSGLAFADAGDVMKKRPDHRRIAERRKKPRSGRRATDNHEERVLRVERIVGYLRQQDPEFALEVIQRYKGRKP